MEDGFQVMTRGGRIQIGAIHRCGGMAVSIGIRIKIRGLKMLLTLESLNAGARTAGRLTPGNALAMKHRPPDAAGAMTILIVITTRHRPLGAGGTTTRVNVLTPQGEYPIG